MVEGLKEVRLVLILLLIEHGETITTIDFSSGDGSNLIEDVAAPNIALLNVVESLVASLGELIDGLRAAHLIGLFPVSSKVQFSLIGIGVPSVASPINNEGHVSTPFSEQSKRLEVGLRECARTC